MRNPAADKVLKVHAAEDRGTKGDRPLSPAPPSSAGARGVFRAPTPKTANSVSEAWRGRKYITPEVFRRRVYAYFGHRLSKSGMHGWLHSGRIAAIRVGIHWLIPESAWEEFLQRCQNGERF